MAAERTDLERDLAALILRCTVGGLMLFHGVDKVLGGVAWLGPRLTEKGLPAALQYGVYLGEVVGPVLLVLGLVPRLAAASIVTTMAFAIWLVHPEDVFALGEHGEYALELHVFYAAGALAAALLGPGRFAIPAPGRLNRL